MEVEGWADEGPMLPLDMDAFTQSIAQDIVSQSIAQDIVQSIESKHLVDTAETPAEGSTLPQQGASDPGEFRVSGLGCVWRLDRMLTAIG